MITIRICSDIQFLFHLEFGAAINFIVNPDFQPSIRATNFDLKHEGFVQLTLNLKKNDDEYYHYVTSKQIKTIKFIRFVDEDKIGQIHLKDANDNIDIINIADFHNSWLRRKLFTLAEVKAVRLRIYFLDILLRINIVVVDLIYRLILQSQANGHLEANLNCFGQSRMTSMK